MKKILIMLVAIATLVLSACDKSETEKNIERDTAISKKIGDVKNIPRIKITPEINLEKKGDK